MSLSKYKLLLSLFALFTALLTGCASTTKVDSPQLTLKTPRYGHAVINDGNHIYVFSGSHNKKLLSDVEIIHPKTGVIKVLADKLIPRRYFSAVWDGQHSVYIIGGISVNNKRARYENRVEIFNTKTHEVTMAKPLPIPTRVNSAVYLDGKIFVFGGSHRRVRQVVARSLVSVLDINKNQWQRAKDMPTAKETKAVVKDGLIYVVGGYDNAFAMNVFERFDPNINQWTTLEPLPFKVSAHSLTVSGNKLYLYGNYNDLTANYAYDFTTEQWQKLDNGYKASRHNAATTLNDKVYVIGGNTASKASALDYIQVFTAE